MLIYKLSKFWKQILGGRIQKVPTIFILRDHFYREIVGWAENDFVEFDMTA